MSGKPISASLCLVLLATVIGWIPAAIWTVLVVNAHQADQRTYRISKEMRKPGRR